MARFLLSLAFLSQAFGSRLLKANGEAVPNEFIVKLRNAKNLAQFGLEYNATFIYDSLPGFPGFAASLTDDQIRGLLSRSSEVAYIEPDHVVTIDQTPAEDCSDAQSSQVSWGQPRTTVESISDGLSTYYHDAGWGEDVDIYVIDTGTNCNHEEFTGGECLCGPSFCGGSDGCTDGNGHGTHCSSTAAGERYGVAKAARPVGVKVLGDNGSGATSSVIAGMNWAAQNAQTTGRISIASMSLGGGYQAAMNDAANSMVQSGVQVAVAAGNDNANACNYSPASAPLPITVGSTDQSDTRSSFSNLGTCVDVFAPGSSITAAYKGGNDAYATLSGTSMATPHVAGGMAALYTMFPSLDAESVKEMVLSEALPNLIGNVGSGSPNLLLHLICQLKNTKAPTFEGETYAPTTWSPSTSPTTKSPTEPTMSPTERTCPDGVTICNWDRLEHCCPDYVGGYKCAPEGYFCCADGNSCMENFETCCENPRTGETQCAQTIAGGKCCGDGNVCFPGFECCETGPTSECYMFGYQCCPGGKICMSQETCCGPTCCNFAAPNCVDPSNGICA